MAQKVKLIRPSMKELRKLYKGLITTSVVHRIETLKLALQWYDDALQYVQWRYFKKDESSIEQMRLEDRMLKSRRLGISTNHQGEKETAFRTSIQFAEKVCAKLRPYSVEKVYLEYESYRIRIEAQQQKLESKYASVLRTLSEVLKPVSALGNKLELHIVEGDKQRQASRSADEYVFNRSYAKEAHRILWRQGILPFVLREILPLSRAAAIEDDGQGHFRVNAEKQILAMARMQQNLTAFSTSADAPRRLAKLKSSVERKKTQRKGGYFGRSNEPKVAGLYQAGSTVALLYNALESGKYVELSELEKLSTSNIPSRLARLNRDGKEHGWTIEWKRMCQPNQVRMVKK